MKTILTPILILFVFIISSCEGPQGEPGPQGAAGTPGAQGQTGPARPAGKINFIATEWIKRDSKVWIDSYDAATLTSQTNLNGTTLDKLTQADLNGGIVLVYDTYYEDKSAINALPYDFVFGGDNHVWFSYGASTDKGKGYIDLYATFAKNIDPQKFFTETTGEDMWYRVIIIPAAAGGRLKGLDLRDYNVVKEYLGLKD